MGSLRPFDKLRTGLTQHARVVIYYSMFVIYLTDGLISFNDTDGFCMST